MNRRFFSLAVTTSAQEVYQLPAGAQSRVSSFENINGAKSQDLPPNINDPALSDGWVNFFRSDDYSAVSYFYRDQPVSNLPALPTLQERLAGLR